jgi:TatD DNase family protein
VWCDAHIHLDDVPDDRLLDGLAATNSYRALIPAGEPVDTINALARWRGDSRLSFATGIHPWYLPDDTSVAPHTDRRWEELLRVVADPRVSAIGETGLDRIRHNTPQLAEQGAAYFSAQVALAVEAAKPLVVHCVRAHAEASLIVRRTGRARSRGMVHAFAGSLEEAAAWYRLGFFVSVGPAVSRAASRRVRAVVGLVPPEQLLIETDAPYMATGGRAGGEGAPDDLLDVAREVASLRGVTVEELRELVAVNYRKMLAGAAPDDSI